MYKAFVLKIMNLYLFVPLKTWFCQILVQERESFLKAMVGFDSDDNQIAHNIDNWPYKIARLINLALKFMAAASTQVICHCIKYL